MSICSMLCTSLLAQMGGPARRYFLIAQLSEVSIAQNHPSSILC
jgi:hypothetical protein